MKAWIHEGFHREAKYEKSFSQNGTLLMFKCFIQSVGTWILTRSHVPPYMTAAKEKPLIGQNLTGKSDAYQYTQGGVHCFTFIVTHVKMQGRDTTAQRPTSILMETGEDVTFQKAACFIRFDHQ